MVTKKEYREIIFMVSSVIFVGILGLTLSLVSSQENNNVNNAGFAISLNSDSPTYSGILYLLQESCSITENDESKSCDEICLESESVCIPLEDNCDEVSEKICTCCTDISS